MARVFVDPVFQVLYDAVQIRLDVRILEAKHSHAHSLQVALAHIVISEFLIVAGSVYLNSQRQLVAEEVNDVVPKRLLAVKIIPKQLLAFELLPEQYLRQSAVVAKFASKPFEPRVVTDDTSHPSALLLLPESDDAPETELGTAGHYDR
jgi:hypothetical protein